MGESGDIPIGKTINETRDGQKKGIADQRRKRDGEYERPEYQPAACYVPPLLRGGRKGVEYALIEDQEQYRQDEDDESSYGKQNFLNRRQRLVPAHELSVELVVVVHQLAYV